MLPTYSTGDHLELQIARRRYHKCLVFSTAQHAIYVLHTLPMSTSYRLHLLATIFLFSLSSPAFVPASDMIGPLI